MTARCVAASNYHANIRRSHTRRAYARAATKLSIESRRMALRESFGQSGLGFDVASANAGNDAGSRREARGVATRFDAPTRDNQEGAPAVGIGHRRQQPSVVRSETVKPNRRNVRDTGIDDDGVSWSICSKGEAIGCDHARLRPVAGEIFTRFRRKVRVNLQGGNPTACANDLGESE